MKRHPSTIRTRTMRWPKHLAIGLLILLAIILLLQLVLAHRNPAFVPDYLREDLSVLLSQSEHTTEEYDTFFRQTGLSNISVDALLAVGELGKAQIILAQEQFWEPLRVNCRPLFSIITMEDRISNTDGEPALAPAMPTLEDGDVIVTFSTHSLGWRHGHSAIVTNAQEGITLEAALIGTDVQLTSVGHWRSYSNFLVLRLKDMTPELRTELVNFCVEKLVGVPYRLFSGFLGLKAPELDATLFGVQCSYLVWYAYSTLGFDVDGDGGRLVTVMDLVSSPQFEVVQIYGIDPEMLSVIRGSL